MTTQISHGKAKKVTYKLDGRRLKAKKKTWKSAITPQKLQKVGIHMLTATVQGKKEHAKKVVTLKLKTVPCRTLFTAQRWRTTAGFGLRLRIDARTAMQRISFKVPAGLLPRQVKKTRVIGFMRVFVAGERGRRRYSLKLAKKGKKTPLVVGAGKPTVKMRKGKIDVIGLPERAAVTELTLYRVKKLDGNTKRRVYKMRARVAPTGGSLSVRPKAPSLGPGPAGQGQQRQLQRADDGQHEAARRIAREDEPDAAAGQRRDQRQVERLVGAEGERVRPGEREADDDGAEGDRRDEAGRAGAEQERAGEQGGAAHELEGAVGGEGDGASHDSRVTEAGRRVCETEHIAQANGGH